MQSVIEALSIKFNGIGRGVCIFMGSSFLASLEKNPWKYMSTSMSCIICFEGPGWWQMSLQFFTGPFTPPKTLMMTGIMTPMLVCNISDAFHTSNNYYKWQYNEGVDIVTWHLLGAVCFLWFKSIKKKSLIRHDRTIVILPDAFLYLYSNSYWWQ